MAVLSHIVVAALAISGPTLPKFPAPSSYEAHQAFNDLVTFYLETARGEGAGGGYDNTPNWAVSFHLHQCIWGQHTLIDRVTYRLPHNHGYFCRFSVEPFDNEDYTTQGFFTHDGVSWRYIGLVEQSEKAGSADLPYNKQVIIQPIVESPYIDGQAFRQPYISGLPLDPSPYRQMLDDYVYENPYNQLSEGSGDLIINAFERDDLRTKRRYDDWVEYPKGTERRNRNGY